MKFADLPQNYEKTKFPDRETATTVSLNTWFQTAVEADGGSFEKVEAWKTQRGACFRVTVTPPEWAQKHLAEFVTEEIQREQAEFEAKAAARLRRDQGSI